MALGAAILLFVFLARGGRRLRFADFGFELPRAGIATGLGAVCIVDMVAALAALFFFVFVAAIAFGIISHAPRRAGRG